MWLKQQSCIGWIQRREGWISEGGRTPRLWTDSLRARMCTSDADQVLSNFLRPTVPFFVLSRTPADALLLSKTTAAIHIFYDKHAEFSLLTGDRHQGRRSQFRLAPTLSVSVCYFVRPITTQITPQSALTNRFQHFLDPRYHCSTSPHATFPSPLPIFRRTHPRHRTCIELAHKAAIVTLTFLALSSNTPPLVLQCEVQSLLEHHQTRSPSSPHASSLKNFQYPLLRRDPP